MLKFLSVVNAIAVAMSSSLAFADNAMVNKKPTAEILTAQGKVLVNQGDGFVAATPHTFLAVGDQLLVGAGSGAEVAYTKAGCTLSVNENSRVTISAEAPCKKGERLAMAGQVFITPTFGNAGGEGMTRLYYVLPFVAVLGVVLVVAANYNEPAPASAP